MFEWDEAKNRANISKHGVSFERATRIFDGPTFTWIDENEAHGELREISIGIVEAVVMLSVVHTDRKGVTRIISARKATHRERTLYEAAIR